jgi:hypothetical protein
MISDFLITNSEKFLRNSKRFSSIKDSQEPYRGKDLKIKNLDMHVIVM